MSTDKKFGLLRGLLRTLGLKAEAVDDIVDWIDDLLAGKDGAGQDEGEQNFPYHLRDDFLSPTEASFYGVLKTVVSDRAMLCAKVRLADLFWVKDDDASRHRIYTNKIDRKHVDFVLCDLKTLRPLAALELDDSSHSRASRQERDAFVEGVFAAASLPLLRAPAKRGYALAEVASLVAPYLVASTPGAPPGDRAPVIPASSSSVTTAMQPPATPCEPIPASSLTAAATTTKVPALAAAPAVPPGTRAARSTVAALSAPTPAVGTEETPAPQCPKCGGRMVLRIARNGANAGNRFWGCANFPNCRSMLPHGEKP